MTSIVNFTNDSSLRKIMENIENCLAQTLTKILVKRSPADLVQNDFIWYDEIIFYFEKYALRVRPLTETDEITLDCSKYEPAGQPEGYEEEPLLDKFIGSRLGYTWSCLNTKGYFDMFALSFSFLHPGLIILSEGSALKLFEAGPLTSKKISL